MYRLRSMPKFRPFSKVIHNPQLRQQTRSYSNDVQSIRDELKDFKAEIKLAIEKVSTDTKMAIEKVSTDTQMAIEKVSTDTKMAIAQVSNDTKSALEKASAETKMQLAGFLNDQQKQFSSFYNRSFFGVVGIAILLVGSAWILPVKENERLDAEMKRKVIKDLAVRQALFDMATSPDEKELSTEKKPSTKDA